MCDAVRNHATVAAKTFGKDWLVMALECWDFLVSLHSWDKNTHTPRRLVRGYITIVRNCLAKSKLALERHAGAVAENEYNEYDTVWFGKTGCWMMRLEFGFDSPAFQFLYENVRRDEERNTMKVNSDKIDILMAHMEAARGGGHSSSSVSVGAMRAMGGWETDAAELTMSSEWPERPLGPAEAAHEPVSATTCELIAASDLSLRGPPVDPALFHFASHAPSTAVRRTSFRDGFPVRVPVGIMKMAVRSLPQRHYAAAPSAPPKPLCWTWCTHLSCKHSQASCQGVHADQQSFPASECDHALHAMMCTGGGHWQLPRIHHFDGAQALTNAHAMAALESKELEKCDLKVSEVSKGQASVKSQPVPVIRRPEYQLKMAKVSYEAALAAMPSVAGSSGGRVQVCWHCNTHQGCSDPGCMFADVKLPPSDFPHLSHALLCYGGGHWGIPLLPGAISAQQMLDARLVAAQELPEARAPRPQQSSGAAAASLRGGEDIPVGARRVTFEELPGLVADRGKAVATGGLATLQGADFDQFAVEFDKLSTTEGADESMTVEDFRLLGGFEHRPLQGGALDTSAVSGSWGYFEALRPLAECEADILQAAPPSVFGPFKTRALAQACDRQRLAQVTIDPS